MKNYLSLFVVLLLAFNVGVGMASAEDSASSINGGRACTMEAKMCPDGSFVSRTGPNCEFSACPGSKEPQDLRPLPSPKLRDNTEAMREASKKKLEDLKDKIKDEKDAVKARIKEARIVGRENALKRFDAAVERINNLKERVSDQITKFEAKGVDVLAAKSFVATAESKLGSARTKISEINAVLATSINELSAENKTKLLMLAQDTQNLLKGARQSLIDAIKSLKNEIKTIMGDEANNRAENE